MTRANALVLAALFFSFSTPWRSFYIGSKSYRVDARTDTRPYSGRDTSWTNAKDLEKCYKRPPYESYDALCPSLSFRARRD